LQAREIVDLVKQEFEQMRREFKLSQQLDAWNGTRSVSDHMRPLIESFNETGMPVALRALLSDTINSCADLNSALQEIAQILGNGIEQMPLLDDMQGIHLIAGSSGSGKSLMTGRLAKQKALRCDSQDVAIISYNDNRFGAWNQTQLIGSQAGVDCFRANTPEMLEQLLQELGSRSLILIDTAGVDVQAQVKELNKILPEAQTHLVVAADASEASVNRQLKAGSGDWDSIMLSRLEEDIRPWPVINALLNTSIPISVSASEPSIAAAPVALTGLDLADHCLANLPVA
jgi:flagellar biosynthesis GTPase FlhF